MANKAYVEGKGSRSIIRPPKKVNAAPIGSDADFGQLAVIASSGDTYIYHGDGNWNQIGTSSTDPVDVPHGGTGLATITDHGVMVGSGTAAVTPLAVGATGTVLAGVTGADPAFSATPSVTTLTASARLISPIVTAPAATDFNIDAIAAQDIIVKLGDAVGVNNLIIKDSASVQQVNIDSDGNVDMAGTLTLTEVFPIRLRQTNALAYIGSGTLVLGTATIANTNILAGDVVLVSRTGVAASTTLGELTVTITPATNFIVSSRIIGTPGSDQTGDVSTFSYVIFRPYVVA